MNKKKLVPELRFEGFDSEWNKYSLGKSVSVKSGYGFKANEYSNSGIPLLQIENVGYGKVKWNKNIYLPIEYIEKCPELVLFEGDIVIALNRPVTNNQLKIAIIKADDSPAILYQRVGKLLIKNEACCSNYIYQAFQKYVKAFVLRESIGSDQPFISIKSLYKLKVPFPILKEQQKIANFLTAIDQRITQLKEKKAALEHYKKGLMQKIFSQEVRFTDDEGNDFPDWEDKKLGDLGGTLNGLSGKTKEDFGRGKQYVQYKQIFNDSKINFNECGLVEISSDEKQTSLKKGDVLFTTSSETPNEIGTSSVIVDDIGEVYLNSFCFGYRQTENIFLPEFSQFFFRSANVRKEIIKLAQGSTRFNMSKKEFMKLKFKVPSLKEQQKIANFLSAIDKKINVMDKQIADSELFKKGLLQRMFV